MKLIFGSDFHGNMFHYDKIFKAAKEHNCKAILLGGDLAPRVKTTNLHPDDYAVQIQLSFYEKDLIPRILKHQIPTYLIFGNSDRKYNFKVLRQKYSEEPLLKFLDNEFCKLVDSDYWIYGYSCVPLSTHHQKDWELIDLDPEETLKREHTVKGSFTSEDGKAVKGSVDISGNVTIKKQMFQSIEKFIQNNHSNEDSNCNLNELFKKTLWMVHVPPYDTPLDVCHSANHEGSKAVYEAIVAFQPKATFHGHIHETVDMSGSFSCSIGETTSLSSGNQFNTPSAHFILYDTEDSLNPKRLKY